MKNKFNFSRGERLFFIILLVYGSIIAFVFLPNYLRKQREKVYIMTPRYRIKYEKGKWKTITNGDDYKLRKFNIYLDNEYFGEYKVLYSSRFTLIDDNDSIVDYDGYVFAVGGNLDTKLYSFTNETYMNDDDNAIVREALEKIDIDTSAFFNIHQKISFDINNDGTNEYIYYVDNMSKPGDDSLDGIASPVSNSSGLNFSVLFMYKNNKVYIIDKDISERTDYKVFEPLNIVDIRDDGKLELIYIKGDRYNDFSDCTNLYNLTKNKIIRNFCG